MKGNIFIHITLKVSHIPSNSNKYINSILKKNELLGSGFARESLIEVESAETTGERCRHLSWRTPLNSSLCTFIGMKHISPTFMYIIPMYLRLTTFTKTLPQMSFHLYFFAIFISLWGSTHDSADCWSAHRSSAARDSFKRVHDWCKAGWRRPGGPPPNKNPGYAGAFRPLLLLLLLVLLLVFWPVLRTGYCRECPFLSGCVFWRLLSRPC